MSLEDRIAEHLPALPPNLRQLLDAELAAGNKITEVELGQRRAAGKIAIILQHPFHTPPTAVPPGINYRELPHRTPIICEFYTPDERHLLVVAKFPPAPPKLAPIRHPAATFRASMVMTFDMWHDGLGYDLAALRQIPPDELPAIESLLINHHPRDWRDIEALAQIDTPTARAAVEAGLKSADIKVRQEAMKYAGAKADPTERENRLIGALRSAGMYDGLSQAIDEAAEFHPPAVVEALLRGALNREGEAAVHFAALLFFIHGKSAEPFDWKHRPFFLRFAEGDRAGRKEAFRELCAKIGVDAAKYVR